LKNSEFYLLVGINDIPWDRTVHWYGRASNFPGLLKNLISEDLTIQQSSINKIKNNIEHQDGIIMATPFTLIFLYRILSVDKTKIDGILNDILDTILVCLEAAKFQLDLYSENPIDNNITSIKELLSEKYLWKKFESEEQDEINWKEYDYSEEHYYWLEYTINIANFFTPVIDPFCIDKFYVEKARKIGMIANQPKRYI